MAQKDAMYRLNKIWDLTVGKKVSSNKGEMRKLMNKSASQITINIKLFTQGLEKQYKKRTKEEVPADMMTDFTKLSVEILNNWESFIKTQPDDEYLKSKKSKKGEKLIFDVGAVNANSGTYEKFRDKNAKIVGALIKLPKYSYLFEGRNKVGKGENRRIRAISDVGHQYSVAEAGRKGFASGMAANALEGDTLKRLTGGDVMEPAERKKLKKLKGLVKLFSRERMKVTTATNGQLIIHNRIFLELDTDTQNRGKASAERKAGLKVEKEIESIIGKKYSEAEMNAAKVGNSPSAIDHIASAIINSPIKKKAYKNRTAKNRTKYKKTLNSVDKTNKADKQKEFESKREAVLISGLTPEIIKSLPKGRGKASVEKGKGDTNLAIAAAGLLQVKRAINKRLPEEVRRNMGRPRLNYRTGRFARSTMIESITPAAKTLMIKYTYRLNPYETFENNGKRRWPSGYNPKPLISKSIRNLALGMFKIQNLTTRRV